MAPKKKRNDEVPEAHPVNQLLVEALAKCLPTPDDPRPTLLFIAGPNGSGKSSLFELVQQVVTGVDFINADLIGKVFGNSPAPDHLAQKIADLMREHYLLHPQSFATETVFSDEKGAKLDFLKRAEAAGFRVVMVYVTVSSARMSMARVGARVQNGGHAVPLDKLQRRYLASMENGRRALRFVETGILLDNSFDLATQPFRLMATTSNGRVTYQADQLPNHIQPLLPDELTPLQGEDDPTKNPKPPGT